MPSGHTSAGQHSFPPASFDRVARLYALAEYLIFGTALSSTRTQYLAALSVARRALIFGDGDGRFLAALLRANPALHATAVDSSRRMLRLLAARCCFAADRVKIHQADALTFLLRPDHQPPLLPVDLVATHFFLDCFSEEELQTLIRAIRSHLAPGALWVVSEFRIPPRGGAARLLAQALVRTLYLGFRLCTGLRPTRLPAYGPLLRQAGLIRIAAAHRLGGLLTAELWQLPATPL